MKSQRAVEWILFFACWMTFAWFNQGGGWNQNARFAEVRAMVEQGRFAIDDYLVYRRVDDSDRIVRVPVDNATFTHEGRRHRLCWADSVWTLEPIGAHPMEEGSEQVALFEVAASGDVAYQPATGHFHPNKPPGTSLLSFPAYWVIFHIERLAGINPDSWWVMNLNMWLTTMFSVGLLSAAGCVLFFRLALEVSGGQREAAIVAVAALAFGSTFFPFSTILFDHAFTAVLLVAAFYCLRGRVSGRTPAIWQVSLAGACAGMAVVTNYVAVGGVVALGVYALLGSRARRLDWPAAVAFAVGGLPLAVVLGWYHVVCYGKLFAFATDFQNPLFQDPGGALGMFGFPRPYVAALLLFSMYRGIFWLAPVLVFGLVGLVLWLREKTWAPEARLCLAVFGFFFFVNAGFNGYHAGFSAGPRYLVPALPFLTLAMASVWNRGRAAGPAWLGYAVIGALICIRLLPVAAGGWMVLQPVWQAAALFGFAGLLVLALRVVQWRRVMLALLAISVGNHFLLTATDAQNALAVGGHARIDDDYRKDDFFCDIVAEYAWPVFVHGQALPLLRQMREIAINNGAAEREAAEIEGQPMLRERETLREELDAAIASGESQPFLLAAVRGPVSMNPVAVYDGLLGFGLFPLGSEPSDWVSFNVGELILPRSRWSLMPVLVVWGLAGWMIWRRAGSVG